MRKPSDSQLFSELLSCKSRSDVAGLLTSLGDHAEVGIDEPFGQHELTWHPFGDTASNISAIGLGTKPGKSLTERVTNAIDAVLQDRAEQLRSGLPTSPFEAAQVWFRRPPTGPNAGLFEEKLSGIDKKLSVVLLDSGVEDAPTVDVLDSGVGIQPEEMKNTILSLRAGNKIKNRYLIGAFGQGGSSTLAFSDYVIIASRHRSSLSRIGFSVIRVMRLDATYKEDCYVYLADKHGDILWIDAGADQTLELYAGTDRTSPVLGQGTLVRHIGYRLTGISKSLGPASGNLYHYLHYTLFDPLLPFRVWDLRGKAASHKNELVTGSRNRLMKRSMTRSDDDSTDRIVVRHHLPMEYIVPAGSDRACIGVEYWVVLAYKNKDDDQLRSNSAEVFVQGNHPIVGTLNGQTQGELSAQMFRELGLGLLSRHVIVHIDASAADSTVRRELFATNREGFKDGPVLDSIVSALRKILRDDIELSKIESELTERIAKRESAATRDEVRKQVTRLLKEVGVQVSKTAVADVAGNGVLRTVSKVPRRAFIPREPLPTLPYPQVTFIRFKFPDQHLESRAQESETVLIETDADAEFDKRDKLGIHASDDALEIESKSKLSGGRIRWRLRPKASAAIGTTGELRAFINLPNGSQVSSSISFEILPAIEKPSKEDQTTVPPFEIKPINPSDTAWDTLWPDDDSDLDKQKKHAYGWLSVGGVTNVFYSEIFPPFAESLSKLKTSKPELVEAFTTNYEVWVAYHAILQKKDDEASGSDFKHQESKEQVLDAQRSIVATMQARQSVQFAEMWKKGLAEAN